MHQYDKILNSDLQQHLDDVVDNSEVALDRGEEDMSDPLSKPSSSRTFFTKRNTVRKQVSQVPKTPSKKDGRYQCYICPKRFTNYKAMWAHNIRHKTKVEDRECKYCTARPFTTMSALKLHVKREHPREFEVDSASK